MATIKLSPEQVLEISAIDHNNPYKNGQRAKDKKTFSRYKFEGTVFSVPSDNPFVQAFEKGEVKFVKLIQSTREKKGIDNEGEEIITTVDSFEFDSFISRAQFNNLQADRVLDAGVEFKIARYQHLATAPVVVTAETLAELENA
jgi:hypothetical protein